MSEEEYIEPNDWVVVQDPIKHREISVADSIKFREQQSKADGVFFIDTLLDTGITNDLWICDFCNDQIPVQDEEGKPLSIIIWNNSRALCEKCLTEFKGKWATEQDETYNCECGCSRKDKK